MTSSSQSTLVCIICSKTFDNRKSYIRHGSYCRKAKTRITTRKKACVACTTAKTRCDLIRPTCSRCGTKDITCIFEVDLSLDHTSSKEDTTTIQNAELDSNSLPQCTAEINNFATMSTSAPSQTSTTSSNSSDATAVPKAFQLRSLPRRDFSLNREYVLCTLRSYPRQLLLSKDPPPFIHPYYYGGHGPSGTGIEESASRPRALINCASIVRWQSVTDADNRRYVWTTIRSETERLLAEHKQLSDINLVASLQAITVYFLMRISEEDESVTDFDFALIDTMTHISGRVQTLGLSHDNPLHNQPPTWEQWILAESLHRAVITICIIDLLFDVAIGIQVHRCNLNGDTLSDLALPCARDLWRASSREQWQTEYDAQRKKMNGRKGLTYGDLTTYLVHKKGSLDNWLSQLDDLGTVVMAAVGL